MTRFTDERKDFADEMNSERDERLEELACEYEEWHNRSGFRGAPLSADEMLAEYGDDSATPLTAEQRAWLVDFIQRWEAAE